jgi:hypothetical protein
MLDSGLGQVVWGDEDEIHASINAKLDAMIARKKSLAEWERGEA